MNGECLLGVKALFPYFNKRGMFVGVKALFQSFNERGMFVGGKGFVSIF